MTLKDMSEFCVSKRMYLSQAQCAFCTWNVIFIRSPLQKQQKTLGPTFLRRGDTFWLFYQRSQADQVFSTMKRCFNPQVLMNFLPAERRAASEIDEPRAPGIDPKPLPRGAALPGVAF